MQTSEHPTHEPLVTQSPLVKTNEPGELSINDRLVLSRLGVYTGLFYALRAKHPPTAAHALRVAIGCSKWAAWRNLPERDMLEVAALLHDIGKIGVPDRVLQKPDQLNSQEQLMIRMQADVADELLRASGASEALMAIVRSARSGDRSDEVALPARMLSIVDAFDSMTTEQVFRRAMGRAEAIQELAQKAKSQSERELIIDFAELISEPRPELETQIATRWLNELVPNITPGFWESNLPASCGAIQNILDTLFHHRLLDTVSDATVYIDSDAQVLHWNRAAEKLTGRPAASLINCRWTPELMGLQSVDGKELSESESPLEPLWSEHSHVDVRLRVKNADGIELVVRFWALPVFSGDQELAGAILLVRDASNEATLEQKVQTLHEIATQDPLTKVANRAELNRKMPDFLDEHVEEDVPGSLIICDIDYFKRINDNYGHQAGDEALVVFADLLRNTARGGDLVARYGGEEFVVLCEGCDLKAAMMRAEQMRKAVEDKPIPALKGRSMTSSFGVTQIQPGDDSETLLARADRALFTAKENGRNRVEKLGDDSKAVATTPSRVRGPKKGGWRNWFSGTGEILSTNEYLAKVPKEVAIQKLEGFINDHKAELKSIKDSRIVIRVDCQKNESLTRKGDRPAVMLLDVSIVEVEVMGTGRRKGYETRTMMTVSIRAIRARDRRSEAIRSQATKLLQSFQAYLVAEEIDDAMREDIIEPR